jgi:phenylacetate-CoA ligase
MPAMLMPPEMSTLQALLHQSEWSSWEKIRKKQIQLINQLIQHAHNTVPFYKKHYATVDLNGPINNTLISKLPLLSRAHVQFAGDELISQSIPKHHGACYPIETSGSTGQTVRVLGTDFTRLFYDALMLREHAWYQRDFHHLLMAIRWVDQGIALAPTGIFQSTWGPPIDHYKTTGSSVLLNISSKTDDQIAALLHYKPRYLLTYPSQVAILVRYCLDHALQMPNLLEIRTTGESLTDTHMALVKQAWPQVRMSDIYSCCEIGGLAQQCPEHHQYHVNAEHVYLEILDDHNNPCAIGQPGKVFITSLLNYATPLIRYELGDYATWGEPCPCGRGLPVIQRILGRKRNRLILPNGESRFPYLGDRSDLKEIADIAIRQFQFIQHTVHDIEIKVVTLTSIAPDQESQFKKLYQRILGHPFNIAITYCDDIPSGPNGKFEEFISHVPG